MDRKSESSGSPKEAKTERTTPGPIVLSTHAKIPPPSPALCKVSFAVDALRNTMLTCVSETGTVSKFDTSVVTAMRSMLGSKVYKFRVSRVSTLTSGTGTLAISTSTNLTQYSEGTALAALFDECRMDHGELTLQPATIGGGNANFAWVIGFLPSELGGSTVASTDIGRLDYIYFTATNHYPYTSPSSTGGALRWKCPGRNWGFTGDEGVSNPRIISGFNGTWLGNVVAGTPSNSVMYFGYIARVIGSFRNKT